MFHSCMYAHIHFVLLQYVVDWHPSFFLVQVVLEVRRHNPTNFSML